MTCDPRPPADPFGEHARSGADSEWIAMASRRIDRCRSCGGRRLHEFLDLGRTPLANALRQRGDLVRPEPRFPLVAALCVDCTLVQITETVHPTILFREYMYASSYSETVLHHAAAICEELRVSRSLDRGSFVIEIASNDGYLLQYFMDAGIPVLGIEPARNIAQLAQARGVPTRPDFFSRELAGQLVREGLAADVILANNVLAHVSDLNGFVAGVAALLRPDGIARFEFPYIGDLLANLEFDTIYHEHLCYFSAGAIDALLRRHGLVFTDVRRLPIHGGTLRVTAARRAEAQGRRRVEALIEDERARGLHDRELYNLFATDVAALADRLRALVVGLKERGHRVAAYGASAKGSTLLNYVDFGPHVLDFVVDRSRLKQGRFTPGTALEILPPEHLLEARPDYVLLLTWNFADEILAQQEEYRSRGGRFVIPLPEPRVV